MADKTPLELAQFTVRFGEEHQTFKDSREYQDAVALLESEKGRVERAKDHSFTCAKVRCCMSEADTCRAKCTCKTPLELALEVMDSICSQESSAERSRTGHYDACDIGCRCGDCCERLIAAALVERLTPVEAQKAPTLLTGAWLCGACHTSVEHQTRFCPNCGKPLVWK